VKECVRAASINGMRAVVQFNNGSSTGDFAPMISTMEELIKQYDPLKALNDEVLERRGK